MKIKQIFFLILFSTLFSDSFTYISNNEISIGVDKNIILKEVEGKEELLRSLDPQEVERLEKDLLDTQVKYIQTTKTALDYNANIFYGADYFYLGSNSAGAQDYSLMRAKINKGSTQDNNTVEFVALSPEEVYLNGIKEDKKSVKKTNPIYNKRIDKLTLQGRYPVLTLQDSTIVNETAFDAKKLVCMVTDFNRGTNVKTNEIEINDSNSAATSEILGLAASSNKFFAAVKSNAGSFGDGNGGFALLEEKGNVLTPLDATTGNNGNKAFKLDLTANTLFAITQNASDDVDFGSMYWDPNLQRLFIGLINAKKSNVNDAGGAVSVLVGRLDENKLIIEPVIALEQNLFTENSGDHVLGFYYINNTDIASDCFNIKTMKTSTGKNYLIVNGVTSTAIEKDKIFAFPLVGLKQSDGSNTPNENVGKIVDKNDTNHNEVVQNNVGMWLDSDSSVLIGRSSLPIPLESDVQDLFIINDSVYASVAENRSDNDHESGIFRSTALFDENGNIRAWTSWQRVAGTIDKVYGSGIDINTGNFWYLTESAGNRNTVKVTQWGKSKANAGSMGNGLTKLLFDQFSQENAGVHQLFNFDEETPSITRNAINNRISFMASLGYKKVALIQTGEGNDIFNPTQIEFEKNTNVFVIEDDALNNLGPICCSEISRVQAENSGWLFIGGHNGLAVLRQVDGNGWDGQQDSAKLDLATIAGWKFKEIGDFSQVRKLVARGGFIYVMTLDSIYRIKMDANKFKDMNPDDSNAKTITPPPGYLLDMIIYYRAAGDTYLLVATSQGLFYSNAINDLDEDKTTIWTRVLLNSGSPLSKPVTDLSFLDVQKGGYTTNGNLYVLTADLSLNLATVYRFDIQNGQINPIEEKSGTDYFYSFGELRTNFVTDGSFGYSMLPKHFSSSKFLRNIRMIDTQGFIRSFERNISLDLENSAYNIGKIVQNTASGAWVVPGDWGIRVNE